MPKPSGRRRARRGEGVAFIHDALATETDECISWPFGQAGKGYGRVWNVLPDEPYTFTHRAVCVLAHGDRRSEGLEAEHLCKQNRLCINKRHIAWATGVENNARKVEHGTQLNGEQIHLAKLTDAEAQQVYNSPLSAAKLARLYGFKDRRSVYDIRSGRTYPRVDRSQRWGNGQ